jgi:ribosomal protein S18 acetylase RimI-like enzyme
MSYSQIDISEVGPPEYPLIAVLRDTIFAEHNHVYRTPFADMVRDRQDVISLIAHLEGNPIGYKVGYRDRPGTYYSYSGGVLKDYRGQGIAKRLQDYQHAMIKSRGYTSVFFNSFNKFRNMMFFGLSTGFVPVGMEHRAEGEISIKFTRELSAPNPPPRQKLAPLNIQIVAVGPAYYGLLAELATQTIEPSTEEEIERAMSNRNPLALVAFVDGKAAGFKLGYGRDARGHMFESAIGGVLPDYRHRGVASALAEHQIQAATAMGYHVIRLHTRHDNVGMIRLCLRTGFNIAGMLHHQKRGTMIILTRLLERPNLMTSR